MSIFKVTLTDLGANGRRQFLNFDCAYADVEEFYDALSEKGAVFGDYLLTGPTDEKRLKAITGRRPRIIGIPAIYSVETVTIGFVENGEEVT